MAALPRFNFDQLKDLKNLDINKVLQILSARKTKAMIAGFAAVTVIGGLMVFNGYRERVAGYQRQMQDLQDKMDVIRRHERSLKALKVFWAALPGELEDNKLIIQLTEYAVKNNVDIIDYVPDQSKNEKLYDSSRVRLNVRAGSFGDLLAFVRTIERAPYSLRVESFSSGLKSGAGVSGQSATADITISSVRVKK